SHGVAKTYRVTVTPHAMEEKIIALTDGVVLDDGTKTKPAVIRVITDEPERTVLELTIKEGKNRQIRRMCEAVGLQVARLKRTQVGPVKLGMLKPGAYRMLAQQEVNALVASATKTTAKMESLAKAEAIKGEAVKRNFGKGKKPSEFPSRNTFKKPTKRNEKK
ncbi:MAG: pseudouridine synthase, partial [Oscillospiraceae bacterium]